MHGGCEDLHLIFLVLFSLQMGVHSGGRETDPTDAAPEVTLLIRVAGKFVLRRT